MIGLNKIGLNQVQLNRLRLNAPFPAYGKMAGGGGSGDGFPQLPGDVTRWHFGGLTNEMMAAMDDPRIEDVDHKGRFLSFKNFAWKGMSGVGGYAGDFSKWANNRDTTEIGITKSNSKVIIDVKVSQGSEKNIVFISKSNLGISNNVTIKITSTYPEGVMKFANSASNKYLKLPSNGVITLQDNPEYTRSEMYLHLESADLGQITIEQLPLYPGFILGDGVDDFAVTEKELNFEDTYTVYTAFIPFQNDPANNMVLCGKNHLKDFYITYSDLNRITFYSAEKLVFESLSKGFNILCCKRTPDKMVIKNLITDKSSEILANDLIDNPGLYYLWKSAVFANYAKAGIAGQIIDNGHFTTDEEDENILNWHKKQYPWLFPDQAWTVTGKTNEDEDRATIANITGNGNDLVLSNFGFAEGSGYGLYAYNFNSFNLRDNVVKPTDVKKDSFRIIGTGNSSNVLILTNESDSANWKIRITGMKDGDYLLVGNANKRDDYVKITKDGVYTFQKQYVATSTNGIWYNSSQEVDVLVEQIPEYEGYLITDGVDDEIISAKLIQFADKFTIVGDWKFMEDRNDNAGLLKANQIYIYNATTGMRIYLKQGSKNYPFSCKKINALTSDGWVYDEKWDKYKVYPIGSDIDISSRLFLGFYSSNFTKIALKNLGIYNDQLLSKDDCIKAYNYLQTLKAK